MIDQLKTLGIEKGKPFTPDAETKKMLNDAAQRSAARGWRRKYEPALPPFFEGSALDLPRAAGTRQGGAGGLRGSESAIRSTRAAWPTATPSIGIKRLGAGQFYMISIKDKDGKTFDGGKTYRLHVPPNVPVEQYWSLTAYDRADACADQGHVDRASRASQRRRGAEERRRLGGHLLRAEALRRARSRTGFRPTRRASSN